MYFALRASGAKGGHYMQITKPGATAQPYTGAATRADVIDWLQALHDHLSDRDLHAGQSMPTRFRTRLADVLRRLQLGEDLEVMK